MNTIVNDPIVRQKNTPVKITKSADEATKLSSFIRLSEQFEQKDSPFIRSIGIIG